MFCSEIACCTSSEWPKSAGEFTKQICAGVNSTKYWVRSQISFPHLVHMLEFQTAAEAARDKLQSGGCHFLWFAPCHCAALHAARAHILLCKRILV